MIGEARFRENSGEEGAAIQEEEIIGRLRRGDPAGLEALLMGGDMGGGREF